MKSTKIEWTEQTWNPTVGCSKISLGCKNCYADVMSKRLQAMGTKGYQDGFSFKEMPERLVQPLKIKKPTKFFVNSMSDLFHEESSSGYIDRVFEIINKTPHHIYQILTKREKALRRYFKTRDVPSNVWLGVSVENKNSLKRIDFLRNINANIKFLSIEPLLEDLGKIDLNGIHWVIVGGESGPKARPMKEEWADNIRKQCANREVAFFFKQWGTWGADEVRRSKYKNGRSLNGKEYNNYPNYSLPEEVLTA